MKKMISICCFAGGICVILIMVLFFVNSGKEQVKPLEEKILISETEEKISESMAVVSNENFYIGISDGYLVVYYGDSNEIFCETNVRISALSDDVLVLIEKGQIVFENEYDLYDFLESYSS